MPSYRSVRLPPRRRAAPGRAQGIPRTPSGSRAEPRDHVYGPRRVDEEGADLREEKVARWRLSGAGGRMPRFATCRHFLTHKESTRLSVPHSGAEVSGNPPVQITGPQHWMLHGTRYSL